MSTRFAGRISSILVREGDLVQKRDVLADMDTTVASAQKMRATAAVPSSDAAVTVAKFVVTQGSMDIRRTEIQLRRAGLVAAQAGVAVKPRRSPR